MCGQASLAPSLEPAHRSPCFANYRAQYLPARAKALRSDGGGPPESYAVGYDAAIVTGPILRVRPALTSSYLASRHACGNFAEGTVVTEGRRIGPVQNGGHPLLSTALCAPGGANDFIYRHRDRQGR